MPPLQTGLMNGNALNTIAAGASNGAQAMAGQAQQANEAIAQANANLQNKQMQQQTANTAVAQQLGAGAQPSKSAMNGNTLGKMLKLAMMIYGGGAGAGTAGTIAAGAPTAAKTITLAG